MESERSPGMFHAIADPERGGATVCGMFIAGTMDALHDRRLCGICHAKLTAAGVLARVR